MDITIYPGKLSGQLNIIPSKSMAHRYLICAAFASNPTELVCPETNRDIEATVDCLKTLGAEITRTAEGYRIVPIQAAPSSAVLNCCESGSTLRFLLPVAGALGVDATFLLKGSLPHRPLSPLWEEMERMGCRLEKISEDSVRCTGRLQEGHYQIDGGISSQFVSGLLFALPLIGKNCSLTVTGKPESRPYIEMTRQAISLFGYPGSAAANPLAVEGDWSNGAFWLAANALGNSISVKNLNPDSAQGDRAITVLLCDTNLPADVDASDIPDLIPVLAVVAAAGNGGVFRNIQRLRLKESDRVSSTVAMIEALGGKAEADQNTMIISGTGLIGGTVDAHNDHRIAMSAAIAATACHKPVTILGAEAVRKSYPTFWEEYQRLGGNYEQHIR